MWKERKERLVALVLMIAILCSVCLSGFSVSAENTGKSADIILGNAPEKEFANWTFSDLGIGDQTITDNSLWDNKWTNGKSLDKTLFTGKIKFAADTTNFGNLYIGGNGNDGSKWRGFVFTANGTKDKLMFGFAGTGGNFFNANGNTGSGSTAGAIATFDPAVAGTTLRGNSELEVALSVEYLSAADGKVTMKVGVFFDGVLYDNTYYTVKDVPEDYLKQSVRFYPVGKMNAVASYVQDVEKITLDTAPEKEFANWTFSDLGIADQTITDNSLWDNKWTNGESLDKTLFTGKIKFAGDTTNFGNFYIGGNGNDGSKWRGFLFTANGTTDKLTFAFAGTGGNFFNANGNTGSGSLTGAIATFTPAKAGTTLRGNSELEVALSVEYVSVTDGKVTMKVGVFFDRVLYNNTYYTVKDVPEDYLKQSVRFYPVGKLNAVASLGGKQEEREKVLVPVDMKNITFMDAGILDGTDDTFTGDFGLETLNGTVFSAIMRYNVPGSRMHYGLVREVSTFGGIAFRLEDGKLVVSNEKAPEGATGDGILHNMPFRLLVIEPKEAGVGDTFLDKEFRLQVSTEFVDMDNDGQVNDIKLGVFINGYLYRSEYVYIKDNAKQLGTEINFNTGTAGYYASYNYEGSFQELTAKDFGLDGAQLSDTTRTAVYDEASWDATAVTMMMNFPKEQDSAMYLGSQSAGVRLQAGENGSITLCYVDPAGNVSNIGTLEPGKAGLAALTGQEIKWRFTFRIGATDEENGVLRLGIYINSKLYNGETFKVRDVKLDSLKRIIGVQAGSGAIRMRDFAYEELTLHDFSILDTSVTSVEEGKDYRVENYCDLSSLDGSAFHALVKFPEEGTARFSLGGGFWRGILLDVASNGRIEVGHLDSDASYTRMVYVTPDALGTDTLLGKELEVTLTFDVLETTGGRADLRVGIYVNGTLYQGKYFTVCDIDPKTMTRTMKLWVKNTPFEIKSVPSEPDLSLYGFDNATWKRTLGL